MVALIDVERRLRIMFNLVSIHCMNVTDGGTLYDIRGRAMHSVAQKKYVWLHKLLGFFCVSLHNSNARSRCCIWCLKRQPYV